MKRIIALVTILVITILISGCSFKRPHKTSGTNPNTWEKDDSDSKYKKTNYGTEVEKAIQTAKRVEDNLCSKMTNGDNKKGKYRRYKHENGVYQEEGLSGYFTYREAFDLEGNGMELSESLFAFNSVMYSILLSGESGIPFDGVTFSSSETELVNPIRVDVIDEKVYMTTKVDRIEVMGVSGELEFFLNIHIESNSFELYTPGFTLTYLRSTQDFVSEKDAMLSYFESEPEFVSKETLEKIYNKLIKDDKKIEIPAFLNENVDYMIRSKKLKNEYYYKLTNSFNYKYNDELRVISEGGVLSFVETDNDFMCFEIAKDITTIASFDSFQNYYHQLDALYIPKSVKAINRDALLSASTSVIFTEYTYDEMPEDLLNVLLETMKRREIYFNGQFDIDENDKYIPSKFYIKNVKTNKRGIEIEESLKNIFDYQKYESMIPTKELCSLNNMLSNLYKNVFEADSVEAVNKLIDDFNKKATSSFEKVDDISLLKIAIEKTLSADNYRLASKYDIGEGYFEIEQERSFNNVNSLYFIEPSATQSGGYSRNILLDYCGVLYDYNSINGSYEIMESYDEFKAKYDDIAFLDSVFAFETESADISYDEEKDVYYVKSEKIDLEIKLVNGFIYKIKGKMKDLNIESATIDYVNCFNMCVSKYDQAHLPNVNLKYTGLNYIISDLKLECEYNDYRKILGAYSHICSLASEEEKDTYYLEILNLALSLFDYENYNLYYVDDSYEKIILNENELPMDLFVRLMSEFKDPSKFIRDSLIETFAADGTIVSYSWLDEFDTYHRVLFETGSELPFIRIETLENSYNFIPNKNGHYVVIIDDKFVETVTSLDKYSDITQAIEPFKMLGKFVEEARTYDIDGSGYCEFYDKENSTFLTYEYNDRIYTFYRLEFMGDGSFVSFDYDKEYVSITKMRYTSWEFVLPDITKFVYDKHAKD